jgi:hypothetical protein
MLPPHIAECNRLDSTTNDSQNAPVHTSRSHRSLVIRVRGGEDGRCTSCCRGVCGARCVVGSLVLGQERPLMQQKNRHQTHRSSHSARMPNIRRARARTLSTHPDWRSRGECSAMCGGSIYIMRTVVYMMRLLHYKLMLTDLVLYSKAGEHKTMRSKITPATNLLQINYI